MDLVKISPNRQEAILDVVALMRRHGLTVEEISRALAKPETLAQQRSAGILSRLFAYIGGIFLFVGLVIYIGMRWEYLDSLGRIFITLGTGFCLFLLALVCSARPRLERGATPLFLLAALLQPGGILVWMSEYSRGGDPAHGLLWMNLVMAIQQGCAFKARDRTVLAFTTLLFASSFFVIGGDLLEIDYHLISMTLGLSLLCVAWSLDQSRHQPLAGLCYFFGSLAVLATCYDWWHHRPWEILFLGLAGATIFLSTLVRSRSLLGVGTLAMVAYVGDFMARHFSHNLNAPLLLMVMGFLLIAIGALAVKINNTYIKQS